MANDDGRPLSCERSFGHCIVTWEIKNYGRALYGKSLEITTPEFSIKGPDSRYTKWKLTVHNEPNSTNLFEDLKVDFQFLSKDDIEDEEIRESQKENSTQKKLDEMDSEYSRLPVKNLMLILERAGSDEGPSTVWLDCKVYFIGIDGVKFPVAHHGKCFQQKYKYGFHIGVIYDLEREFEYNSGITTILCDMIVKDIGTDTNLDDIVNIDDCVNIDLYGLSEDLQWIFDQQKFCDAEIVVGSSKKIMAHKAILCSHCKFFEDMFKEQDTIDLLDLNYNEMLKVLEYMYSHELGDVIGRPSVSIYDCVIYLNLTDLAAHYIPEEQKITTTLDIRKLTFSWIIEKFSLLDSVSKSSPILCNNIDHGAWQIHLYPKGIDGNCEFIAIAVECIEGDICGDLCIQCAVLNDNESKNIWKTLRKSDVDSLFQNETFIKREHLLKLLYSDTLRVGLKIRMCLGKDHSVVNNACIPVLYSEKKAFENLSSNMLALYESNKFTDIVIKIDNEEIKAHKFILSARSYYLSNMLEETNGDITLSNISPDIFKILLYYMYCAALNVTDTDTIIDVYMAAEEFVIPRLREKCSRILRDSMTVDKVCNILLLADDYEDQYLKTTALEFISSNEELFKQHIHDNMKPERQFLYSGVEVTGKDENTEKTSFFMQSKVKKITILKYNNDSIVSTDYEITACEKDILFTKNCECFRDEHLISHELENELSNKLLTKCPKESRVNGEEEELPNVKTTSDEGKLSSKPQLNKSDIPFKKRYRNETDFSSNSEGEKTNKEYSQTEETIDAPIKSDETIKNIQNSPQNKNLNEDEVRQTTSEIIGITTQIDEQTSPINQLKSSPNANNEQLNKAKEELEAMKCTKELQGNEPNSSTTLAELNGKRLNVAADNPNVKVLQSCEDPEELHTARLESSTDLDELNRNKSNIAASEPSNKGLDVDTILKESYESKLEVKSIAEETV